MVIAHDLTEDRSIDYIIKITFFSLGKVSFFLGGGGQGNFGIFFSKKSVVPPLYFTKKNS